MINTDIIEVKLGGDIVVEEKIFDDEKTRSLSDRLERDEKTIKIGSNVFRKLVETARWRDRSIRNMTERLLEIGLCMDELMDGNTNVLTNGEIKVSFYFDEDKRTEVYFRRMK